MQAIQFSFVYLFVYAGAFVNFGLNHRAGRDKIRIISRLVEVLLMSAICGMDCCRDCGRKNDCGGCKETDGHPFGGSCIAAEYIKKGGVEAFEELKRKLIDEFNALGIKNLQVNDLNLVNGFYVNLEYRLANGQRVKLLKDNSVYFGNQIEIPESDRCYGIAADDEYLLVCEYGCGGSEPEIVVYKRR